MDNAARQLFSYCAVFSVLILLWQLLIWINDIPPYLLPTPYQVLQALLNQSSFLIKHASLTLTEIILGLLLGSILGVVSAILLSLSPRIEKLVFPILLATQAMPVFAIAPLLVLWLGYGLASKIFMATLIIYFPITSAFYDGLRRTDASLLDLGVIFGARKWTLLRLLKIPSAMPNLATGLRVAATLAPIGAVVGEWVGSSAGLGFIMIQANSRSQVDLVFAALFILIVMVLILRAIMDRLTRKLIFWMPEQLPTT